MTDFILAGALGAIALVVWLLFRQLRKLSWQLTQLRVERDSDRILRDIGYQPEARSLEPTEEEIEPVRRKRHLALYMGGLAAVLAKLHQIRRTRPRAVLAGGVAGTVAIGTAVLLVVVRGGTTPPSGGLSPTLTPAPTGTATASAVSSASGPSGEPPPSTSGPPAAANASPGGEYAASATEPAYAQPSVTLSPTGEQSPGSPTPSCTGSSPASSASPPSGSSAPAPTATGSGSQPPLPDLCVDVRSLLDLRLCLCL